MVESFNTPFHRAAVIIGGGPSAQDVDFNALGACFFIGVNDSFRHAPHNMIVSIDGRWMGNRWKEIQGKRAWLREDSFNKWVGEENRWTELMTGECRVFENPPGEGLHCIQANNSGLAAVIVAYFMGFKNIFLYGFDMGFSEGRKHWYPDYEWAARGNHMYPDFCKQFDCFSREIPSDVKIYLVGQSRLTCFERLGYAAAKNHIVGLCSTEL